MYLTSFAAASIFSLFATSVFAAVPPYIAPGSLTGFDNDTFVHVTGADNYCMIMPRDAFSNIGDAQRPGGSKSYCTSKGRFDDVQGRIHANFWSHVEFKNGTGASGGRQAQLTGCIQPEALDRLNPDDVGEAYTSTGPSGRGNPRGSKCLGYKYYLEIVEPRAKRGCIRCCDIDDDCHARDLGFEDTKDCTKYIPGNYTGCS